jgi:hypothetical protein
MENPDAVEFNQYNINGFVDNIFITMKNEQ